jgi:repressor LexA
MREELTDRQREVYEYLLAFSRENLYQPSHREIADHFGWSSPNAASEHLTALERKGWLELGGGNRAVKLLAK